MDMLKGDEIAEAQLTDWRKLAQGLHARYLVADFGTGARFVAAVGEAGDALGHYPSVSLGTLCDVEARGDAGLRSFRAEVVRVDRESIILSPFEDAVPTFSGALVTASPRADRVAVGPAFLGRAVDPLGRPCDGLGPIRGEEFAPLHATMTSPLERTSPHKILQTGMRAVDGLLTGLHEPESSHLQMLEAIGGRELVETSYRAALDERYLWHEFGDVELILPG